MLTRICRRVYPIAYSCLLSSILIISISMPTGKVLVITYYIYQTIFVRCVNESDLSILDRGPIRDDYSYKIIQDCLAQYALYRVKNKFPTQNISCCFTKKIGFLYMENVCQFPKIIYMVQNLLCTMYNSTLLSSKYYSNVKRQ